MAKFKRKFSKKKRTFKKRRFIRKRQSLPKYDGMVRVKMQSSKEMIIRAAPGNGVANFLVSWGQQISATAIDTMVVRDCPEWVRYSQLYRYFCIAGVRTEYKPYGFNAGSTDIISEEMVVGSSPTGVPITTATIPLAVDFKVRRANQPMSKYVGTVKSRMRNTGAAAATVGSTSRWLDVSSTENYHLGHTLYSCQNQGLISGQAVGNMYVTYYIWFKGQRTDVVD